jgi:hypothetical protein
LIFLNKLAHTEPGTLPNSPKIVRAIVDEYVINAKILEHLIATIIIKIIYNLGVILNKKSPLKLLGSIFDFKL